MISYAYILFISFRNFPIGSYPVYCCTANETGTAFGKLYKLLKYKIKHFSACVLVGHKGTTRA